MIFGRIQFEAEEIRLYVDKTNYYVVHHYFNSFVEDGQYAAAAQNLEDRKYYLIQVGDKYNG